MYRFLRHAALFVLLILVVFSGLDWIATSGLRKSESVWNDIITGAAESEVLIQGSSRAEVHFSPDIIGSRMGMTCYNLGTEGYSVQMQLARYSLYRNYAPKPSVIVQGVDAFSFEIRDDIYEPSQFVPYFDEKAVREAVRPYDYFEWYDYYLPLARYRGSPSILGAGGLEFLGVRHYTSNRDRGYLAVDKQWTNEFSEFVEQNPNGVERGVSPELVDELDGFLADCVREGVFVVLVYSPEYYEAREFINNRDEVLAIYRSLSEKHGVPFLDYSDDPLCYDTKYFYNSQHMNRLGSERFSAEFADTLAGLVRSYAAATD